MARIHVLGVGGTFMAGVARLASELGHRVEGSDTGVYPPMSEQLAAVGIVPREGYAAALDPAPDWVLVGNALSRGNPAVEQLLDRGLPMCSGPEWLAREVLPGRHVAAVAGTHGKTTTASMLAWILERAGLEPGFLIGGVPGNFGVSARLGERAAPFVVEADEYDTAFFDKRSKFVHYRPRTLVVTGIEYDHADIFPDLASIRRQFHHLVRTVPASGRIIAAAGDPEVNAVLAMGCWTPVERFGAAGAEWTLVAESDDWSRFAIELRGHGVCSVEWPVYGAHNAANALAAVAAASALGVEPTAAGAALADFVPARRRLELRGTADGVAVLDDFAHHPSAVRAAIGALRAHLGGSGRILALLDPASNSMRMGVHGAAAVTALDGADLAWIHRPRHLAWDPEHLAREAGSKARVAADVEVLIAEVIAEARAGDRVLVLSNGAFGGIHQRLLDALARRAAAAEGGR